jgi:dephospho-CoA kinase
LVREVYQDSQLKHELRGWWGEDVFAPDGEISRSVVGKKVFGCEADRLRLERVLHPRVADLREARMVVGAADKSVVAFVWDTPLLYESQLASACDATVFVDASPDLRLRRVRESRGWDAAELARRENSQMPLDKKRAISDYVVVNTTNAESTRVQVRELLSRILAGESRRPLSGQIVISLI